MGIFDRFWKRRVAWHANGPLVQDVILIDEGKKMVLFEIKPAEPGCRIWAPKDSGWMISNSNKRGNPRTDTRLYISHRYSVDDTRFCIIPPHRDGNRLLVGYLKV